MSLSPASKDNGLYPGHLTATTSARQPPRPVLRSCELCRRRKVRCDRQKPCSSCSEARHVCVYPSGRGRAPKRSRQAMDTQLGERLSRLESIIKSLGSHVDTAGSTMAPNSDSSATDAAQSEGSRSEEKLTSSSPSRNPPVDKQLGRLMIDKTGSYYLSNVLWASLANEIDELRDLLLSPAAEEDCEDMLQFEEISDTSPSVGSSAAMLGFRSIAASLLSFHPSLSQAVTLYSLFTENVVPMVRIFHMPSMSRIYWDAIASPAILDKNMEALLFAIYYSAVISISGEQCLDVFGVTREVALEKYRFAVEQALARADLLNTQSMILLQAAVVYLSALRNEDDSRTTWSLTSLVFHIAQSMGLHRDGTAFGLNPFEVELRRRLWWHICILDTRSSEYHGYEPIVHGFAFDTRLPLHVNDADLLPDMISAPPERDEATDMTLFLIRCETMSVGLKIARAPPIMLRTPGPSFNHCLPLADRERLVQELEQRLEEKYLRHCKPTVPYLLLASTVARLVLARFRLMLHYPLSAKRTEAATHPDPGLDTSNRDWLFLTSIEVLEQSSVLLTHQEMGKWNWYSKTHIQWQAVAFVLFELCSRPPSLICDRAWDCVTTVYGGWKMKRNQGKGPLWRPIRRLMAKALYVRETQQASLRSSQKQVLAKEAKPSVRS
ncbi:Zn(II)2Cys6 transcription factor [Aspergillus clavatus NRRL 1]|uniref:Fungal specific transcription factor domain protein n=1 Tax=Aspergillus clavatus (strain ATCC 1007 / CBS 513.65 / DSM 816 / NCTC 3887 / NRRL 1 / QM 1276 / 107) TaxID=344612 RepID=A1CR04_ASPCL|nr:fungal specific transcription factor domain protein [Aspergillus clavatus NRRL 1]EAW08075.1 fungal specific transcription factor domain protein [Aspergillus clavatus NRRL 1]